ncbi:MAG: 16S rRNA (cytidine(1402)-2'-O)-methyltransferase [Bacilli bacterium]
MIRQKSFINDVATLYLVSTPIGNFLDMTYRAIEILNFVDKIYCEDTRVTKKLLSHFNISTKLSSYHIFNEDSQSDEIINELSMGLKIALVSDAGMPSISDPGYLVSKKAIEKGFNVVSIPGANAALTALVASGITSNKFVFIGFLPSKSSQRVKELSNYRFHKETLIFYEAPHRIIFTLKDILDVFGDRYIVIARELTKKYEEYIRGNISEVLKEVDLLKGEIVLIVEGATSSIDLANLNELSIIEHYEYYKKIDMSDNEAIKQVSKDRNVHKNEIYQKIKNQ